MLNNLLFKINVVQHLAFKIFSQNNYKLTVIKRKKIVQLVA